MLVADESKNRPFKQAFLAIATPAVVFHGLTLFDIQSENGSINLTFFNTAALVMFLVGALLIIASLTKPVERLGIVIFPLAAVILVLKMLAPEKAHLLKNDSWGMDAHIIISIIAFSFLNIAAVQAILLALQDWQLHRRQPNRFISALPPLQTMESLLFQMIGVGFILLTFSLLSGFVFLNDIFAQHLAHKTVLSILAWLVFAVLIWGRARYGWRGQTAIRWTLIGFISLLLAYFGSKLVLELILERT